MESLDTVEKWNELLKLSKTEPVLIYKHSSTCPVSREAFLKLENGIENNIINKTLHIVIVQKNREVSDLIEKDLRLRHESPQLIIIKKGEVLYFANHYDINVDDIKDYIKEENE